MKESYFNKFRNFRYNQRSYVVQKRTIFFQTTRITCFHIFGTLHSFSTPSIHARVQNTEILEDHKNERGRMLVYTMHGSSIEIQSGQKYDHRDRRITHPTNNRLYFERKKFAFFIIKGRFELRNERIRYRQTPVPSGWLC